MKFFCGVGQSLLSGEFRVVVLLKKELSRSFLSKKNLHNLYNYFEVLELIHDLFYVINTPSFLV